MTSSPLTTTTCHPRLALFADYREEGWASMDLCAEMLARSLHERQPRRLRVKLLRPLFRHRFGRLPLFGRSRFAVNADRFYNRMWDYPRAISRLRTSYDLFHICDHSYAQLVHELPPKRTGVFCHDLDTFRCLLEESAEPRPRWFRAMTRRILDGLCKAAVVFHTTTVMGLHLAHSGLIDPARLVLAPLGVAPEFTPEEISFPEGAEAILPGGGPFLLHVGSCIPRKRIDVLLDVFAAVRARRPAIRLVKVGGAWTTAQQEQINRLRLGAALTHHGSLSRAQLAAHYRRASLLLVPSEQEGFGIPVIEALACGTAVLASDLPTIREAGGEAASYLPCGDVAAWTAFVCAVLDNPGLAPPPEARRLQSARFSWRAHAEIIADAYLRLAPGGL